MSWLYSQVLVEEYLGHISSDGELSAPLSGSPTQQAYCSPDKMTECSRLSRFGMMFKPLTEDRGEELLMSYLAAFHAKTSPQPEKEQGLTESGQGCGEKWHGSFTRYDPDSSLWRTHQCSLLGDLEPFSETWPRCGMTLDGTAYQLPPSAHRTSATECSSSLHEERWPTPTKVMIEHDNLSFTPEGKRLDSTGVTWALSVADMVRFRAGLGPEHIGKLNPTFLEWLMGFPIGWTELQD